MVEIGRQQLILLEKNWEAMKEIEEKLALSVDYAEISVENQVSQIAQGKDRPSALIKRDN